MKSMKSALVEKASLKRDVKKKRIASPAVCRVIKMILLRRNYINLTGG